MRWWDSCTVERPSARLPRRRMVFSLHRLIAMVFLNADFARKAYLYWPATPSSPTFPTHSTATTSARYGLLCHDEWPTRCLRYQPVYPDAFYCDHSIKSDPLAYAIKFQYVVVGFQFPNSCMLWFL